MVVLSQIKNKRNKIQHTHIASEVLIVDNHPYRKISSLQATYSKYTSSVLYLLGIVCKLAESK